MLEFAERPKKPVDTKPSTGQTNCPDDVVDDALKLIAQFLGQRYPGKRFAVTERDED